MVRLENIAPHDGDCQERTCREWCFPWMLLILIWTLSCSTAVLLLLHTVLRGHTFSTQNIPAPFRLCTGSPVLVWLVDAHDGTGGQQARRVLGTASSLVATCNSMTGRWILKFHGLGLTECRVQAWNLQTRNTEAHIHLFSCRPFLTFGVSQQSFYGRGSELLC